ETCSTNPCSNGATCVAVHPDSFIHCICAPGFAGDFCDYPITTPSVINTQCPVNPCLNGASCSIIPGGSFKCTCAIGFTGLLCESREHSIQNACQSQPCQNSGICYLTLTDFACICPTGYSGTRCDINLAATNPCFHSPCQNSGTCLVLDPFRYRCICSNGFLGVRCEQRICNPNPCLSGGICLPHGNTFQCQCPSQYSGHYCEHLTKTASLLA
ncbi:unnamed protein product, partial [Rotaria sordida]